VKKVQNKTVFFKEAVKCLYMIFWLGCQKRGHCLTAKSEPNQRVTADEASLLVDEHLLVNIMQSFDTALVR
jgi:hypothetical protein